MRRYIFTGTLNTRDLGGYPTKSGEYTKFGRLLRSDAPTELSGPDLDRLCAMGITTTLDLRGEDEVERRPSSLSSDSRFKYYNLNLKDRMRSHLGESDVAPGYFELVHRGEAARDMMRHIACAPAGVLFHCAAGKDRTGVLAAMLLDLCGVPMPDIIADYQVTETYIRERIMLMKRDFPEIPGFLGRSIPEYIEGFFERLFAQYGTTEAFLLSRGVTKDELSRIRGKLL